MALKLPYLRQPPSGPRVPDEVSGNAILWRPDGADGAVKTWAEVMTYIAATAAPVTVWVEQAAIHAIPPSASGAPYDLKHGRFSAPIGAHGLTEVGIQTGAKLKNLYGISGGMVLSGNPQTEPSLVFETRAADDPPVLVIEQNAAIKNNGAVPLISHVLGGEQFFLIFDRYAGVENSSAPIIDVTGGAGAGTLILSCTAGPDFEDGGFPANSFVSSDNSAVLAWNHDGTLRFNTAGAPTGSDGLFFGEINLPLGVAGGAGPLSFRPGSFVPPTPGCEYFACDYAVIAPAGSPIWWDGADWRDAAGTVVP